jgi:aminoglycoside 3-N-acetyltransferase
MREPSLDTNAVTIEQLQRDLLALGLSSGDTVMVHASLRRVGLLKDRGEELITALLNVLGLQGTVMAYVDFHPTDEIPYFDIKRSPARPDYGVFAELVRTWPGAVRSANPGASMAAVGERAKLLCENHPISYGYGPDGPLGKLVSVGGKVLLLGSDPDQVTILHLAEHLAHIPDKRVVFRSVEVLHDDGSRNAITIEEFDTSKPVVSAMPNRIFAALVEGFISSGAASSSPVGKAEAYLLPAKELVSYAVSVIERDYG